jgi:hypothetical protein
MARKARRTARGAKYNELLTPLDTEMPRGANPGQWRSSVGGAEPDNAPTIDPADPLGIALEGGRTAPGGRVPRGSKRDVEG